MTRPTRNILIVIAILVVGSIVALSFGPSIDLRPSDSPFQTTDTTTPEQRLVTPTDMIEKGMPLPILNFILPEFQGITAWWNTANNQALTPKDLTGKVVLVDFWTYSCINCIRTFPFLREMQQKYAENGLVIIGVHTPEFAFEADPKNVEREILRNDLQYPVALDPNFETWNAYQNRYWPAEYLFDAKGRLRRTHFGEGEYQKNEEAIRSLLKEAGYTLQDEQMTDVSTPDFGKIKTPETYFGLERGREFMQTVGTLGSPTLFETKRTPIQNRWDAEGTWTFLPEYVETSSENTRFFFNVQASKLHLVLESADGTPKSIEIFVDGVRTKEISITNSELYDIADFPDAERHQVEIRIPNSGVRFYAATFS
ncbi:MAG: redoxin domain-containing protein [bacterium]|nr:redoxin domain-containing protein [bacterium]